MSEVASRSVTILLISISLQSVKVATEFLRRQSSNEYDTILDLSTHVGGLYVDFIDVGAI